MEIDYELCKVLYTSHLRLLPHSNLDQSWSEITSVAITLLSKLQQKDLKIV